VSRDFCFRFFHESSFPQAPENNTRVISNFLRKYAETFTSEGAPPVSTTPTANFASSSASVVDIGGKFATSTNNTGVNNTGGKLATSVNDASGKLPRINDTGGKFATGARNHQWPAMAEFSLRHPVWIAEINMTACNSVTRKEHFSFIA
jgi:hypothetical protein